jgi:PAS domain S-box-containing protein
VPFITGFQIYPWLERLLKLRRNLPAAYGLALALVALAILVRWLVVGAVGPSVPFITFYPAIIVATLVGGLGPGILATVLATTAAWYLFIPPYHGFVFSQQAIVQLLLFVFICSINMTVAALLNAIVERLLIQQRNIRLLLETAQNGIVLVDDQGTIKMVNAATERLFGYKRAELTGQSVEMLVPERQDDVHRKLRTTYQREPSARLMGEGRDLTGRRKDGTELPVEIGLNPVGQDGRPAVLATVIDISARKLKDAHQQLLIRELEHRTRNLFGVVQAIATNSLKEAKTAAEGQYILMGRLKALSQAYRLVAGTGQQGASLAQLLEGQILVHSNRIEIDGCDLVMALNAAQQFALFIHELSTNALKYGALSASEGRVLISGTTDRSAGVFTFRWKETGGPRIIAVPTRKGFGTLMLIDAAKQFAERVSMDFEPDGLQYELQIALKVIEPPVNMGAVAALPSTSHVSLRVTDGSDRHTHAGPVA